MTETTNTLKLMLSTADLTDVTGYFTGYAIDHESTDDVTRKGFSFTATIDEANEEETGLDYTGKLVADHPTQEFGKSVLLGFAACDRIEFDHECPTVNVPEAVKRAILERCIEVYEAMLR